MNIDTNNSTPRFLAPVSPNKQSEICNFLTGNKNIVVASTTAIIISSGLVSIFNSDPKYILFMGYSMASYLLSECGYEYLMNKFYKIKALPELEVLPKFKVLADEIGNLGIEALPELEALPKFEVLADKSGNLGLIKY